MNLKPPTPDWSVFRLLWKTARRRAVGRQKRQRALMRQKKGSENNPLAGLAFLFMIILMSVLHGALGWMLVGTLDTARIVSAEARGKMVVPDYLRYSLEKLVEIESPGPDIDERNFRARSRQSPEEVLKDFSDDVARGRHRELGGTAESHRQLVENHFHQHGSKGFILESDAKAPSITDPAGVPSAWWPVGGFVFLWWLVMMVCQGEGLELDIQRRRHPMWEWLQSHPVRPVAAFAADMLSPMMANPVYYTAPIFWWIVLGNHFGIVPGFVGGLLIGLTFAVAASAMNKALEISAMLRLSPRSRGAALGMMSWLGYAGMMLPLFSMNAPLMKTALVRTLAPLAEWLPMWPVRALMIGGGNSPVLWQAVISGMILATLLLVAALTVAWWSANQGLQAAGGASFPVSSPGGNPSGPRLFSGNPLYRKELLWFWRDKGAVVQAILIPLTIAGFQVFNLRGLLNSALGSWNGVCGAAILCGTYFLLVLGPRSLASEGGALWIATTWPKGMEELLKAKARLWWMLSNVIVGFILLVALYLFPRDWWRIALAAAGWGIFSRSLAEKTVTLATAPSSSGEAEPAPKGRQWAAMLGTLAFSSGVITGTWSIAVTGMVFSSLTAAAMWQNFRARLPFLFDPWSEKQPPAPSLMHAMIGIAAMVEVIGIASAMAVGIAGVEQLWLTRAIAYGVVGIIAWIAMQSFLHRRGVDASSIWRWHGTPNFAATITAYGGALLAGAVCGGLGLFYRMALRALPLTRDYMAMADKLASANQGQYVWMLLLSVGMAPFAEEYFFRGLLFRALDREWGGWRAMLWSAAYFAIYHPPVSWIPVFALGACSAWCFKKSGILGPCVLMHMVYNAIVVGVR